VAPPNNVEIAIIGAGLSGIGMAIALRRAGLEDFVILERAEDVGGTWRDNTYPGIGVDIPAQAYQFSYELKHDWSRVFAKGSEVRRYIDDCADRYGIRPFVRFRSDVTERVWNAAEQRWHLRIGDTDTVRARFVISAIGPFVDPKPVDLEGVGSFRGEVIHSARWDHSIALEGKRAAIVGTGASAVQIIPEIAPRLARLDVYQRTPIWVAPKWDPRTPPWLMEAFRQFPPLQRAVRGAAASTAELLLIALALNHERIPWVAEGIAARLRERWYATQVRDPAVRAKLLPKYGFGCKRPAVSNTYLATFNRDNVELVTDPIDRVTPTGIRTRGGATREVDVLVLATGFRLANDPENYRRTPVRGRDGFDLATFFAEERAASYEGVSLPGLPNHFIMFGPYGWTGGTWHDLVETTSVHIIRVIQHARALGAAEVEVRKSAAARWTELVRRRMKRSLWQHNDCGSANSHNFDRHGDTPFLRPTSAAQARRAARTFSLDDYEFRAERLA
jgi:cation diffusion facilitator CzcD-associated flavoprotein CzcO